MDSPLATGMIVLNKTKPLATLALPSASRQASIVGNQKPLFLSVSRGFPFLPMATGTNPGVECDSMTKEPDFWNMNMADLWCGWMACQTFWKQMGLPLNLQTVIDLLPDGEVATPNMGQQC